jgi:fructose-1,6-bisphosphatase II
MAALRGEMQAKLWPRNDTERAYAREAGLDLDQVLGIRDLVDSDNTFFAATGVTSGELLQGVGYYGNRVETQSVVMRSKTGTVRFMDAIHRLDRLKELAAFSID